MFAYAGSSPKLGSGCDRRAGIGSGDMRGSIGGVSTYICTGLSARKRSICSVGARGWWRIFAALTSARCVSGGRDAQRSDSTGLCAPSEACIPES